MSPKNFFNCNPSKSGLIKERDNNGFIIPFHTVSEILFQGFRLFVAGHAGCRSLTVALGLVAAYAKLVRHIFAEAFNFTRFRCMQILQFLSNSWCILLGNVTVPILARNIITSAAIAKIAVKKTWANAEIIFFNLLTSFI